MGVIRTDSSTSATKTSVTFASSASYHGVSVPSAVVSLLTAFSLVSVAQASNSAEPGSWPWFINAFFYDGEVVDCFLNWLAVVYMSAIEYTLPQRRLKLTFIVLLLGWGIQVLCWFLCDVVGISIVWAMQTGDFLVEAMYPTFVGCPNCNRTRGFLLLGCAYCGVLVIYYVVVLPFITTVAHLAGILVGALVVVSWRRCAAGAPSQEAVPDAEPFHEFVARS